MVWNHSIKTTEPSTSINKPRQPMQSNCEPSFRPVKLTQSTRPNREPAEPDRPTSDVYAATEAGAASTVFDPAVKYAKKARHRVKADTYEYKGSDLPKQITRKRKRRGGSIGNENFHAANVDAERVTLRPNKDQHLFSRAKKYLPFSGHDLPDLTFTKMDYLSRPPQTRNLHTVTAGVKEETDDYIVRKTRKGRPLRKISMTVLNRTVVPSRSELYPTKFATDKQHNTQTREILNEGVKQRNHDFLKESSWTKTEGDVRVEEFRLSDTSRNMHNSTPISWSTSPSRNSTKPPAKVSAGSARRVRSHPSQDNAKVVRHARTPGSHSAQSSREENRNHSDDLTLGLLRCEPNDRVAAPRQNTMKTYYSLEDLKRISEGILGEVSASGSSALQPHIPSREPSSSGQKSQSAPSPVHGPSAYLDDVIMHQCDRIGLPSLTPLRQSSGIAYCESTHGRGKDIHCGHIDRGTRKEDWCTAFVPIYERNVEGNQAEESMRCDVKLPRRSPKDVSYLRMVNPRESLHVDEHGTMYGYSAERQLDAFDLELLETMKTINMEEDPHPASHPGPKEAGVALLNGVSGRLLRTYSPVDQYTSPSARSPTLPRLLTPQDDPARNREPALRLARPSLDCKHPEQDFNPFRRSYMLL